MDLIIRQRQPIRASFTRMYNNLIAVLNEAKPVTEKIECTLASLERIALNLSKLDDEICKILLQDETNFQKYEEEHAHIEEYCEKLDVARVRVKAYFQKFTTCQTENSEKTNLKLPKIELVKFGGEVREWLNFWSQFKRIHDNRQLDDVDKFQYLIQCMVVGSRAREVVDSYPPTAENYIKCIESLKIRFGREELLVEFYVRELLGLVVKNVTNSRSKINLIQLYDKLESHLRSLESIGMTSDKYAAMLFPLVESCIPEDILRVWLRNPSINKEDDSYSGKLSQLLLFLRAEVEGEERISLAKAGFKQNETSFKNRKLKETEFSTPTANDLFSKVTENIKQTCIFCKNLHESKDCFKGQSLSYEEKQEILRKNKGCFSCLKVGHRSKFCKSNVRCLICGKKHWAIMCPNLNNKLKMPIEESKETELNATLSNQCSLTEVFLQTLLVVIEVQGKRRIVRALIDNGSQRSYVLKSTVSQLGLNPVGFETLTHVVFGGSTSRKEHKRYNIKINDLKGYYSCRIEVLDQTTICGPIPRIKEGPWLNELKEKGIHLSDTGHDQRPIELLIGADFAGKLYSGSTCELSCGLSAIQTRLGWSIMGRPKERDRDAIDYVTSLLIQSDNIVNLWKIEAIGITDPCERESQNELEEVAVNHFKETVRINDDGRYEICLPWTQNKEELPSNREGTERRLIATTSKLKKENKFESYNLVFEEWLNENIIEESFEGLGHYLPHRGVFKTNSTTNIRPVFDASFKQKGHLSLNECLIKGPNLLELIPGVLLKFRQGEIGVISDIKKAFLQISVAEKDREYLKFLWWKNKEQKVKVLQHCRVVFGLNCSPFLLAAVLRHHLEKYSATPLHEIADKLKTSLYVDNCVTSVNNEEELQQFIKSSTEIMSEAHFELRGWEHSEVPQLSSNNFIKSEVSPVLGLMWNKLEDTLYCNVMLPISQDVVTRRSLLSVTQRVFDPIGFTCPVMLLPKIMLQESWKSKLSWDAEIPNDIKKKFLKWIQELKLLHLVKIPRHAFLSNSSDLSLHVFSDACATAYAAVVYLRCKTDLSTSVQLLMAKSRVAPLREISIPRLELLSCCIGARLAEFVKNNLKCENIQEYFWTDSTTALQWIKKEDNWGIFVRNRVNEIRKLTLVETWRHIPGKDNPADLPSRGCSVERLIQSKWWEGPDWLRLDEDFWPKSESLFNEDEVFQEKMRCTTLVSNELPEGGDFLLYFSSYTKIIRMMGWILRFIFNSRNIGNRRKGELSVNEINEAEKKILKIVQEEVFSPQYLKNLKSLNVFKDEEGIIRVKTKLLERKDAFEFRFPFLLPSRHKLVQIILQELHLKLMHAGPQIVLSNLRERFWILKGRKSVRQAINRCVKCKRHSSRAMETTPTSLPENRIKDASTFEVVGVDLAGPLILKGGEKSWIVLFTCAIYRAIHLELITSLSSKAFLLSLRRFIARRGRPKIIYSDNGTNFVGVQNLFLSIDWTVVEREASIKKIEWKFSPPAAPWWGGFGSGSSE